MAYLFSDGSTAVFSGGIQQWLNTTAAGQTLTSSLSNVQFTDSYGGGNLVGTTGNTVFAVGFSNTKVSELANQGTDTVIAYCRYALPDNVEDMFVKVGGVAGIGNSGKNVLVAEARNITLRGAGGNDVLIDNSASTAGAVVFDFATGSGNDVIYGFKATGSTHDFIRLDGYGYTDFSQLQSKMTQVGSDVRIAVSATDSVTLRNTLLTNLDTDDFLLAIDTSKLKMTFHDEFDSLSLWDPKSGQGVWKTNYQWNAQTGTYSWQSRTLTPNHEQQIYVDPNYAGKGTTPLGINPFAITNGELTIHAGKTPTSALSALNNYQYTSGLLTTEKSFSQTYGYFEIKAELPSGKGVWPAFWLVPSDGSWPPELDVMESAGGDRIFHTSHTNDTGTHTALGFTTDLASLGGGYHTYGVLWTAEKIEYFVDGVAVASTATPADMDKPMHMLVNLAIGGDFGGNAPSTFTGADLKVDYIRAYGLADPAVPSGAITLPAPDATTPSSDTTIPSSDTTITPTVPSSDTTTTPTAPTTDGGTTSPVVDPDLANVLTSTSADETLTGGKGNDSFVFGTASGHDIVTDFGADGDTDTIDISAYLKVGQKPTLKNVGNDVLMSFASGDTITLQHVQTQSLVATDTGYKMGIGFFSEAGGEQTNHALPMFNRVGDKLAAAGDKDWYSVNLAGGVTMNIALLGAGSGVGSLADGALKIYDSTGKLITSNLDSGSGADAVATFKVPATGTYYVVVESQQAGGTGTYSLEATYYSLLFENDLHKTVGTSAGNAIYSGHSNETLIGGGGADSFRFGLHSGHDVITDFGAGGKDAVDLRPYLAAGYKPTLAQVGNDTVINLGTGDDVTLLGVSLAHVQSNWNGFNYI